MRPISDTELLVRLISVYRKMLHYHSTLYYYYHTSEIADAQWDEWSSRLIELQNKYPQVTHLGYLPEWFYDWNGNTGMHLPRLEL